VAFLLTFAWRLHRTEDQIFELVICAAVGQSTRLYEAGLAGLAEATATGEAE